MLSAGFQTLSDLKARLLPDGGGAETDWDTKLTSVGLGVAAGMDRYCGRTFARGEDVAEEYSAQATAWTLMRYPVESLSAIALVDPDGTTSSIATTEAQLNKRAGIVELFGHAGSRIERIRMTYTGGYWLDDGGVQPAGSTALPDDLREAFLLQVQHVIEASGLFGDVGMRASKDKAMLPAADLMPIVRAALNPYRRYGGE